MSSVGAAAILYFIGSATFVTLTSNAFAIQQLRSLGNEISNDSATSKYEAVERGSLYSANYRIFFKDASGYVSPWHDIPLYADAQQKLFNMIVEVPRWSNAKMEMATNEPLSPIKQDVKNGGPRFVHNIFPYHGYIWNYGALPQTWENNQHVDSSTGANGDNDPLDVIEIGSTIHKRSSIIQVKVVGCAALIDSGEIDWKMMAIDVNDPLAAGVNSVQDVEQHFPGLQRATLKWFKTYKIPEGKPANEFAFDGQFKDQTFCYQVINQTHEFWKGLIAQPYPPLNTLSRSEGAAHVATAEAAAAIVSSAPGDASPAALPAGLDGWHYIQHSELTSAIPRIREGSSKRRKIDKKELKNHIKETKKSKKAVYF